MLHNLLKAFDNLQFDKDVVLKTLEVSWKGLLAIFATIIVIVIVVKITAFSIDAVGKQVAKFKEAKAAKEAAKANNDEESGAQ